ncbi:hypothetical protein [Petralouisia muris]|nr:hypothetical protein [Petralouisia muris]
MAQYQPQWSDYVIKPLDISVMAGEFIISVLAFLILYKRNGYEKG